MIPFTHCNFQVFTHSPLLHSPLQQLQQHPLNLPKHQPSLMSAPLEHDYIGLSEASSMENPSKSSNISPESDNKNNVLNLKATELRLGLPGLGQDLEENACKNSHVLNNNNNNNNIIIIAGGKRGFFDVSFDGKRTDHSVSAIVEEKKKSCLNGESCRVTPVAAKAQVVGWPPIRSFRKNTMAPNLSKNGDTTKGNSVCGGCLYVKVSMDGAPYLRKVDLQTCKNYTQLSNALEKMFTCFTLGQCSFIRGKERPSESNLKDLLHRDECVLTYEDKDGDWMLVGDVPWEMFVDSCKRLRIMKGSEAIGLAPRSMEKCKNRIKGM